MKESADRIQDGLKIYKMFHVPLSEKRNARHPEVVGFVQRINEGKKPALCVYLRCVTSQNSVYRQVSQEEKSLKRYANISRDFRRFSKISC
jgi:hypothetical protein